MEKGVNLSQKRTECGGVIRRQLGRQAPAASAVNRGVVLLVDVLLVDVLLVDVLLLYRRG
jgi:hypothetical protein